MPRTMISNLGLKYLHVSHLKGVDINRLMCNQLFLCNK